MATFISIFLALVAACVSVFALFSVKKSSETGDNHLDEIMRLKQQVNETNDRLAQLKHEHNTLLEQFKRLQEVSINNDMQVLLNTAIKDYNEIASVTPEEGNIGKHERARKQAAEKVLQACNEVCQRFIAEDLSHNTFASVYKSQLQDILNSDDLKEIYTSVKGKYPYIERVLLALMIYLPNITKSLLINLFNLFLQSNKILKNFSNINLLQKMVTDPV